MFLKLRKILIMVILVIVLFGVQAKQIVANYSGIMGEVEGARSGGGNLTTQDNFVLNSDGGSMRGLRIYFVEDVGGGSPRVVSNVKDTRHSSSWPTRGTHLWQNPTRFSTSANGLGTRWDFNYGSNSGYANNVIDLSDLSNTYSVTVPQINNATKASAAAEVLVRGLYNQDPAWCSGDHKYKSCLHAFLVEQLGITDPEVEEKLKKDGVEDVDLTNYFIVIESVYRFLWQERDVGSSIAEPRAVWAFTVKELWDVASASVLHQFVNQGEKVTDSLFNWQLTHSFNVGPLSIRNQNDGPLSYINRAPSEVNKTLQPGSLQYGPYGTLDAQDPVEKNTIWNLSHDGYSIHFGPTSENKYNHGTDMEIDSGLGIAYWWFAEFSDGDPDCDNLVDQALDGLVLTSTIRPEKYQIFIDSHIKNQACCPEFGNRISGLTDGESRDIMEQDYDNYCGAGADECFYDILTSCPDCTEDAAKRGLVSDIDDWDCIFVSDESAPTTPFNFRDHYIQKDALIDNPYCKAYCREDLRYEYPVSELHVPAGFHFTISQQQHALFSGREVPNWGPVEFAGEVDCRPTIVRDKDLMPLDDDHDDLYIDHIKFVDDYTKANEAAGAAYDEWQILVNKAEAIANATYYTNNSCPHFFEGSHSGEPGCYEEQKMYECGSGGSPSGKHNERVTCTYETTPDVYCEQPNDFLIGDWCCECEPWVVGYDCPDSCPVTDRRSPKFNCPSDYSFVGGVCYKEEDAVEAGWECIHKSNIRFLGVRSATYRYSEPNILPPLGNTTHQWCANQYRDRANFLINNYEWETSSFGNEGEIHRVANFASVDTTESNYIDASDTYGANDLDTSSAQSAYNEARNDMDTALMQIKNCQEFTYTYELGPELEVTYQDSVYPDPEYYRLDKIEHSSDSKVFLAGGQTLMTSSTAEIDFFNCNVPPSAITGGAVIDGEKCPPGTEEYPDNDSWLYHKNKTITYTLDEDTYSYVEKADARANFSVDSKSHHELPDGVENYIKIPYGNFPVHYWQEGPIPADGVLERDITLRFAEQSFGPNHRFNDYVFGLNIDNLPHPECFSYDCPYYIYYEFPSHRPEDLDMFVQFRPVDLNTPFPGPSGDGRIRGKNWKWEEVVDFVITNNRGVGGYNLYAPWPDGPQALYSISLSPIDIVQIRGSGAYNVSNLECEEDFYQYGTEQIYIGTHKDCRSPFVTQYDMRAPCLENGFDKCRMEDLISP